MVLTEQNKTEKERKSGLHSSFHAPITLGNVDLEISYIMNHFYGNIFKICEKYCSPLSLNCILYSVSRNKIYFSCGL